MAQTKFELIKTIKKDQELSLIETKDKKYTNVKVVENDTDAKLLEVSSYGSTKLICYSKILNFQY